MGGGKFRALTDPEGHKQMFQNWEGDDTMGAGGLWHYMF